ncbi:phytase [Lentinula aciculospora]|uniref:Phytase A n=1 Tax=Lentinula aciculospora TaxID=153920 RepID=A0A9W9DHZ9_9AGAR|nr:phytase [Lentinula aciculospora]
MAYHIPSTAQLSLPKALLIVLSMAALLCFTLLLQLATRPGIAFTGQQTLVRLGHTLRPYILQESWGPYTPYFPVDRYQGPPKGCVVTQVNILQRHGARFPTAGPSQMMASAVAKLQQARTYHNTSLDFIRNYTYDLGIDDLLPFGASQSSIAGAQAFHRYKHLLSEDDIPFVRSSSASRVVMSAQNWTYGFSTASNLDFNPVLAIILDSKSNDTLHNYCPAIGSSESMTNIWIDIYAKPIIERLNAAAPGANLTTKDVHHLMELCAFHSAVIEDTSDWCQLFDEKEWKEFEYAKDLDKYYGTGYGQALGPVEGVGYINELISRLTSTLVHDSTQTNTTLDSSPITFPLNRTIYADFTHDNQLIAIFSAMGLFQQPARLDPTNPNSNGPDRTWVVSQLTPFAGRMVIEKILCQRAEPGDRDLDQNNLKEFVRILVNDAVQPLEFCSGVEGLCDLRNFIESQEYAISGGGGDWQKCFEQPASMDPWTREATLSE